jgi:hypothetical protein
MSVQVLPCGRQRGSQLPRVFVREPPDQRWQQARQTPNTRRDSYTNTTLAFVFGFEPAKRRHIRLRRHPMVSSPTPFIRFATRETPSQASSNCNQQKGQPCSPSGKAHTNIAWHRGDQAGTYICDSGCRFDSATGPIAFAGLTAGTFFMASASNRRHHRKSRKGCLECKRRHIKVRFSSPWQSRRVVACG